MRISKKEIKLLKDYSYLHSEFDYFRLIKEFDFYFLECHSNDTYEKINISLKESEFIYIKRIINLNKIDI